MKQGILDGIRVIDFTKAIAGPLCGSYLADMGAEVIKVEGPKGDPSRQGKPGVGAFAAYFTNVNRGKKSIALDLKTPEGKALFTELVKTADVLLENNRPGVMDRLGFGVEACKKLNPNMIYASVSGFGQTGPYAMRPAYDLAAQAMGGTMYITGTAETIPLNHGAPTADVMTALNSTIAILASLFAREKTGIAQRVETSLLEAVVGSLLAQTPLYLLDGEIPMRDGSNSSTLPLRGLQGQRRLLCLAGMGTWKLFCEEIINRPDLVEDERFVKPADRMQHRPELREIIEAWAADKTVAEIVDANAAKFPCTGQQL